MKGIQKAVCNTIQSTADLLLVPLSSSLIPDYLSMFSPHVQTCLGVSSVESEYLYLHTCLTRMRQGTTFCFCIFLKKEQQLIGALEMRCIPYHASHIYTWINETFWGKGYFKQAMKQAVRYYFLYTGFPFIVAHVDTSNMRSYYAFKSCRFSDWGFCMGPRGKQYCLVLRSSYNS